MAARLSVWIRTHAVASPTRREGESTSSRHHLSLGARKGSALMGREAWSISQSKLGLGAPPSRLAPAP